MTITTATQTYNLNILL